jgi:HAD superfamily hydrolase (TIGR01509 family)
MVTTPGEMNSADGTWPRAAIFDCDGLLIDTSAAWTTAYRSALDATEAKGPASFDFLNGASVRSAAKALEVPEAILRSELESAFDRLWGEPLPGVRGLLERLDGRMPLAVATNGPAELVGMALGRAGLLPFFAAVVSAEGLAEDKPAPDVYEAACRAVGVDPSDAIAFEDSALGVASARSAGLVVVYAPSDPAVPAEADLRVGSLGDPRLDSILGEPR